MQSQAVLIVNVASHCGYTDRDYRELQALRSIHDEVQARGKGYGNWLWSGRGGDGTGGDEMGRGDGEAMAWPHGLLLWPHHTFLGASPRVLNDGY